MYWEDVGRTRRLRGFLRSPTRNSVQRVRIGLGSLAISDVWERRCLLEGEHSDGCPRRRRRFVSVLAAGPRAAGNHIPANPNSLIPLMKSGNEIKIEKICRRKNKESSSRRWAGASGAGAQS